MPRLAYVNGAYVPLIAAGVSIEDRGYQFADGVYEVCLVVDGALWDADGHFRRWKRSLKELHIAPPVPEAAMMLIIRSLLRRNRLRNALVYLQATRGVAPRNHVFPAGATPTSLVITAKPFNLAKGHAQAAAGVSVISAPDNRWARVDIKSISLLPNILAKEAAKKKGAIEAWLTRDGFVTEGAASNAWIVTQEGALVTHPLGADILGGITRETTLECARSANIKIEERPFSLEEAFNAREAFITSATNLVTPIIKIDDRIIGEGAPGEVALHLRARYIERCRDTAR